MRVAVESGVESSYCSRTHESYFTRSRSTLYRNRLSQTTTRDPVRWSSAARLIHQRYRSAYTATRQRRIAQSDDRGRVVGLHVHVPLLRISAPASALAVESRPSWRALPLGTGHASFAVRHLLLEHGDTPRSVPRRRLCSRAGRAHKLTHITLTTHHIHAPEGTAGRAHVIQLSHSHAAGQLKLCGAALSSREGSHRERRHPPKPMGPHRPSYCPPPKPWGPPPPYPCEAPYCCGGPPKPCGGI